VGLEFFRAPCGLSIAALAVASFVAGASSARADQPFLDSEVASAHLPATPSVTAGAAGAFVNPAAWSLSGPSSELAFWWDTEIPNGPRDWGLSTGRTLGFAMKRTPELADGRVRGVYDLQAGLSFGDRAHHLGLAWRWSDGAGDRVGREHGLLVGTITRPSRFVSIGTSGLFSTESSARQGTVDLGIRPLGEAACTVFGSYSLEDDDEIGDGRWKAGAEIRPVRGVRFGGAYLDGPQDDDDRFALHVGLTLDDFAGDVLPGFDHDGDHQSTTLLLRQQPPHRGIPIARWFRSKGSRDYVAIDLENRELVHQNARFFDSGRIAWIDLLERLDRIARDPGARGVALNLTGFRARAAMAWELREKLAELQRSGKEILISADRLTFVGIYLASIADRLVLDPLGHVFVPGPAISRTYVKGTLDKLGIGFQELRYFTHKTADESFSRTDLSEADREQLQRVVDVVYEEVRGAVARDRGISEAAFDAAVDGEVLLGPEDALEHGFVDAIGRWHDLVKWIEDERHGRLRGPWRDPAAGSKTDERWGRPARIAVVHAVGICAMDSGIRGRATSKFLRSLEERGDIAAVVLRADSPGGDALPSDLIAEATRRLREKGKPVIVSQGGVAASGGYWISMDGTRVMTTPFTITGSIGVIGGWFYENGLAGKTGFTSDRVQRGAHADLFAGTRYPLLPVSLPARPLTNEELGIVESKFRTLYDDFVARVAAGRGISEEDVRRVGEGRVWMGGDAIDRELCDEIGGLEHAIAAAKEEAGLDPSEDTEIVEYPRRRLFLTPRLFPSVPVGVLGRVASSLLRGGGAELGAGARAVETTESPEPVLDLLETAIASPMTPQLLVPPSTLPAEWIEPAH